MESGQPLTFSGPLPTPQKEWVLSSRLRDHFSNSPPFRHQTIGHWRHTSIESWVGYNVGKQGDRAPQPTASIEQDGHDYPLGLRVLGQGIILEVLVLIPLLQGCCPLADFHFERATTAEATQHDARTRSA